MFLNHLIQIHILHLAKVSDAIRLGGTIEFTNREDGLPGMSEHYGMHFQDVKAVDGGLRYTAIQNDEVDVIDAFATDGLLEEFQLKVLQDDKQFFPPYYAVPLVREEVLKDHPEVAEALQLLAGKIDDAVMRELNYKVDSLKQSPEQTLREFLVEEGLISE
ncbi:hypothetical protein J9303_19355 [Bacillaceae bacterium Marseille-Q3522]|nr:hypothetical protein [Bacillaceae bacterium Marseille-Q3522]